MKNPKQLKTSFTTYTLDDRIGEGGSGTVYAATDESGAPVAIKTLDPKKASREKLKRFENEYRFCSRNVHPNILTVHDHGLTPEGTAFFVMPRIEASLREFLPEIKPDRAIDLFGKMLNGVENAHTLGVIHRDLKPENILINQRGKELVIADFGIARFEEDELYTTVETRLGTRLANFQYAAPEQRVRGKAVDVRADIYALGLILNELFTGELAHGTNFKTIGAVSTDYGYLDVIVNGMLQQAPAARYKNIDEIKKELIARGNENIARQKLSLLTNTVISTSDVDDPLVTDRCESLGSTGMTAS